MANYVTYSKKQGENGKWGVMKIIDRGGGNDFKWVVKPRYDSIKAYGELRGVDINHFVTYKDRKYGVVYTNLYTDEKLVIESPCDFDTLIMVAKDHTFYNCRPKGPLGFIPSPGRKAGAGIRHHHVWRQF